MIDFDVKYPLELRVKAMSETLKIFNQAELNAGFFIFNNMGGDGLQKFFITSSKIQIRTSWLLARPR